MALSQAQWAMAGAGVAIFGGFTAGALLRRRLRRGVDGDVTISQAPGAGGASAVGGAGLGAGIAKAIQSLKSATPAGRLSATIEAFVIASDLLIERYGPSFARGTYGAAVAPQSKFGGPGSEGLFWDKTDRVTAKLVVSSGYYVGPNMLPYSTNARWLWDSDSNRALDKAERLLRNALDLAAEREQSQGDTIQIGNEGVSLGQLAEQWATEQAIGYLVSAVPGGAAVLEIGKALGGPGWNMGITSAQVGGDHGWDQARAVALERAADLIAYAHGS